MKRVSILWHKGGMSGKLELTNAGKLNISEFALRENEHRLDIEIDGAKLTNGAFATVLTVRARENPFSFFVRDVRSDYPIYIREYEVAVTDAEDCRTYEEITKDIASKCLRSKIDMFEQEPEESFETAAAKSRSMRAPTWLGISRDIRMFEVAAHQVANDSALWDTVTPMNHHSRVRYEEMGDIPIEFNYFAGRGIGCRYDLKRRLEKGVLPILNVVSLDDDMRYEHQMFVTNEIRPLKIENVEGTHYLISDKYAVAPTKRTPEQQAETDRIHDSEMYRDEETVLYLKVTAINTAKVPRYCFMRLPQINVHAMTELTRNPMTFEEGLNAFSSTGNVVMTSTLNSEPFGEIDSSILLTPGEKATFVFKIPHRPIPKERAEALIKTDYDAKLKECIAFWEKKLESMAKISLPEKRIEEMMKAGYLHLDLVCFGKEPDDAVAPVVGVYTPIGTESTPIIQYFEAVGNNKLAQRSIMYFMKKQRDDGFMQNFQTYMSETGPALWNAGEHYKITRDKEWLESIKDNIIRACDYCMRWMDESRDESLRNRGYGMLQGKCADCEDNYRDYMLNVMTYGGMRSVAEALMDIDPVEGKRIGEAAEEFGKNIMDSLTESFAVAPVIPLSDGSWCPSVSQWPDRNMLGLESLFALGGYAYTHGSMVISDNRVGGGIYNTIYGLFEPEHPYARFIDNCIAEMLSIDNVGFSQPYYTPHPYNNLKLGEVGSFLREFYNNMAALADRETYTFWEHYFQVSPHKTHEEGWFLNRCIWMLFFDDFGKLELLRGVPRVWLEDSKTIYCEGMGTRFGKMSMKIDSCLVENKIKATISLERNESPDPETVTIRLPHPLGCKASSVKGGTYDKDTEIITITGFTGGTVSVELRF